MMSLNIKIYLFLQSKLKAIVLNNEIVENLRTDENSTHIFDKTNFYAECGGQVGDLGTIEFIKDNIVVGLFDVTDTQVQRGYVFHHGVLISGVSSNIALLKYNAEKRNLISSNHSATHILNHFLRSYTSVEQDGSLVDSENLRFDFIGKKISDDQLFELEDKVNDFISSNAEVTVKNVPFCDIVKDKSIIKMSGESYPDIVRVIIMKNDKLILKEICGGTHVSNTSMIGKLRIISEGGIKANTKRMIVVTNINAEKAIEAAAALSIITLSGNVISFYEQQVFLRDRRNLIAANEKSIKLRSDNIKRIAEENIDFIKSLHGEENEKLFVYNIKGATELTCKESQKVLTMVVSKVKSILKSYYIYVKINNSIEFIARNNESDTFLIKLQTSFGEEQHARICGDCIQGTILNENNFKSMDSIFNN